MAENCREKYNLFPNYFVARWSLSSDQCFTDGKWMGSGSKTAMKRILGIGETLTDLLLKPQTLTETQPKTSTEIHLKEFGGILLFSKNSLVPIHVTFSNVICTIGKFTDLEELKDQNDFDIFSPLRYEKIASSLPLCPKSHFRIPK